MVSDHEHQPQSYLYMAPLSAPTTPKKEIQKKFCRFIKLIILSNTPVFWEVKGGRTFI